MQTFDIRRIRSGVDEGTGWVSLWFRAEGRLLEPLHLVCSREAQGGKFAKFDTLYLERDDQSVACYGGAKQVVVNAAGIAVQLNRAGVKALGLPAAFFLAAPNGLSGWAKARRAFAQMAGFPTGLALVVAEPIAAAESGGG
jgi:hypothetical protein